jgi:SCF-associated factor 1
VDLPPTRLPPIPSLPDLPDNGLQEERRQAQLIQIAAFDRHIVGLTNLGHILKITISGGTDDEDGGELGEWKYVGFILASTSDANIILAPQIQ